MKNYFLVILTICTIAACNRETYYYLENNEKYNFEVGDQLLYISNFGRADTFTITRKEIKESAVDEYGLEYHQHETISGNFSSSFVNPSHNKCRTQKETTIELLPNNYLRNFHDSLISHYVFWYNSAYYTNYSHFLPIIFNGLTFYRNWQQKFYPIYTMKSKDYENVFYYQVEDSILIHENNLKEFYFNYDYGIIKFTTASSEEFKFIRKI